MVQKNHYPESRKKCCNSSNSDPGEAYPDPAFLVLGTDNATDNHTIQIIGKDDYLTDDNISYTVTVRVVDEEVSHYLFHASQDKTLTAVNIDNETAGFTFSQITDNVYENGSTASFKVHLNTRPLPNQRVVFVPSSGDISEVEVSPNILIYDNNNWHDNQTITLKGINLSSVSLSNTLTIYPAESLS